MRRGPPGVVLERSAELSALDRFIAGVRQGYGDVTAITGVAGIGKSTLLEAGAELARAGEMRVLLARADELAATHSWGVVRELFGRYLGPGDPHTLGSREGPIDYALRALDIVGEDRVPGDTFAVTHGLYWLAVDLSQREPLLIAVDDLQWCDPASARFLIYLAERLEGSRIGLLLCWRTGEPAFDEALMARFDAAASREDLLPRPLSPDAVEVVLERHLGHLPSQALVDACHDLTSGNPFLVTELAAALLADHATDDDAALAQVKDLAPRSVRRSVSLRIGRLGRHAAEVAIAVAVLGDHAQLVHVAALAGLDLAAAARAADALAAADILEPDTPLRFTHSLVRAGLYEDVPPVTRRLRHAEAARLLAEHGASDELVCAQVLRTDPRTFPQAVEHLSAAARQATARGAPEAAVTYLTRALEETSHPAERCRLLHSLGSAEALLRLPTASEHLDAALKLAADDVETAAIAAHLSEVLGFHGRWSDALRVAETALAKVSSGHSGPLSERGLMFERLQYNWAALAAFDPDRIDEFDRFVADERRLGPSASRQREATLAVALSWRGAEPEAVPGLLDTALAGLEAADLREADPWLLMRTCAGAFTSDDIGRLERLLDELFAASRLGGSIFPMALALTYRTAVRSRRGDLVGAASDLRAVFEFSLEHELRFGIPPALWYGADALIERDELGDLAALVGVIELEPDLGRTSIGAVFREVKGRLALAARRFDEARRHLEEAAAVFEPMGLHNPNGSSWRSALGLSLVGDDRERALQLVESELADARRLGWPRPIGVSLQALGLIEGGERGLECLRSAVDVLATSEARLEQARAAVALGGALRRANRRTEARSHLRTGLDLAERCGAMRLTAEARSELVAAGARPRRTAIRGRESLTAAERRVAELASQEMTNREIAQALFVTINTVEGHLKQVFQKLSINSRKQIGSALERAAPTA